MQKHSIKCATVAQFKIFVSLDISLRRFFVDGTSELSTKHRKDTALDFEKKSNKYGTTFFFLNVYID